MGQGKGRNGGDKREGEGVGSADGVWKEGDKEENDGGGVDKRIKGENWGGVGEGG